MPIKRFLIFILTFVALRVTEVGLLFVAHIATFIFERGGLGIAESAYSTILLASVIYIDMMYFVVTIVLAAICIFWKKSKFLVLCNFLLPIYIPIFLFMSGSLPNNDISYLFRVPAFLVALVISGIINAITYWKLYQVPVGSDDSALNAGMAPDPP